MKHKEIIILLLIISTLLLLTVGSYGVIETSDARYAEIGREMFISDDWLHPNLLDIHHYHKPPLTYQITALGYELFGVNPFGARFFLQIAILIQILLVYLLTLEFIKDKKVALWASAIYFTFPLLLSASRNLTTDTFLTLFTLLAIYSWVKYRKYQDFIWLYLFTISLGLGFLTKGPVVFIAPIIFVLLYNRLEVAKNKFGIHHILSWGIFLIIASSWFIYLAIDNPAFWDYFIGRQTVDRFSHNVFNRSEPFWYFIALAPILGMPWLFLLPWFSKKIDIKLNTKSIEGVLLISVIIPLIFFSISTSKRIFYILPLYPLFAIMVALMLDKLSKESGQKVLYIISGYAITFFTALAIVPWLDIKINFPTIFTPISIILIFITIWIYRKSKFTNKNRAVFISTISASYLLLASTLLFSYSVNSFKIATPITEWIKSNNLDKQEILVYNKRVPSIAFELNHSIISLYDGDRSLNREVQFETNSSWREYLYNLTKPSENMRLKELLDTNPSMLITYKVTLPQRLKWLQNYYPKYKEIGKWRVYYQ
jgi:4-amino-4-deoxy-L-arabinose transferase